MSPNGSSPSHALQQDGVDLRFQIAVFKCHAIKCFKYLSTCEPPYHYTTNRDPTMNDWGPNDTRYKIAKNGGNGRKKTKSNIIKNSVKNSHDDSGKSA